MMRPDTDNAPAPQTFHIGTANDARTRLLKALAELVEQQAFAKVNVADIVRAARVSKRTFYEHFTDRVDCYLALVDTVNRQLIAYTAANAGNDPAFENRTRHALAAYLDAVASSPGIALSIYRELPALGEAGATMRRTTLTRFADRLVAELSPHGSQVGEVSPDVAIFVVGGLNELVSSAIEDGRDVRAILPIAERLTITALTAGTS
ncbi:TetR/AcrR family transcriptional regulator [Gordonia sinesedis]